MVSHIGIDDIPDREPLAGHEESAQASQNHKISVSQGTTRLVDGIFRPPLLTPSAFCKNCSKQRARKRLSGLLDEAAEV